MHQRDAEAFGFFLQRGQFCLSAKDGGGDAAGERGAVINQRIAAMGVEAAGLGNALCKEGEPARHQNTACAIGGHGRYQRPGTRRQRDQFLIALFQSIGGKAVQLGDPFPQCAFEVEFASHGARGDRGDFLFQTRKACQFVEAFLVDDSGIHVADQQFLAAIFDR